MKKNLVMSLVAGLVGCASSNVDLPTQADVDLNEYAGTWYEQARLPNRFQKDCMGDVQADYTLRRGDTISVINRCRAKDGSIKVAEGEGRLSKASEPRNPARLEVRFAPKWTSWLPMVWGDYWIMKLEDDYQYSLVGTPDRKYLWVLSRAKRANKARVTQLLGYAKGQGFDTSRVIMAPD